MPNATALPRAFERILRRLDDSWMRLGAAHRRACCRAREWLPNLPQLRASAGAAHRASLSVIVREELEARPPLARILALAVRVRACAAKNGWRPATRSRRPRQLALHRVASHRATTCRAGAASDRLALPGERFAARSSPEARALPADDADAKAWRRPSPTRKLDTGADRRAAHHRVLPDPRVPEKRAARCDARARCCCRRAAHAHLQRAGEM
jgi:hypothetical protein